MREIKFRVWEKGTKTLLGYEHFNIPMNNGFMYVNLSELKEGEDEGELVCHSEFHSPPMLRPIGFNQLHREQSTGLKDKNGNECFEGDIIRVHEYKNELIFNTSMQDREIFTVDELKGELKQTYVAEVRWSFCGFEVTENENCDAGFGIFEGDQRHSGTIHEFEVIGNIHENPDLL